MAEHDTTKIIFELGILKYDIDQSIYNSQNAFYSPKNYFTFHLYGRGKVYT